MMSNFVKTLEKYNSGLKYYVVVPADKVISEDGKYTVGDTPGQMIGYAVENKETGVVEHTSVCLPAVMFQANHFDDMLTSLLDGTPPMLSVVDSAPEDVVPH
jgi:hypothetical protein